MNKFKRVLSTIAYVSIPGATILASTGVGLLWGAALASVGVAAGGLLHFLDSPRTPEEAVKLAEQLRATAKAVRAAARPGKGQSGS